MTHDAHDAIQRALNEHRRRALEQRYGARCLFDEDDVPPEIIGEWLDFVEEFETQHRGAGTTTVRAFIGEPGFPSCASLSPADLRRELLRIFALLASNAIEVHFERLLSDEEQYRFLTEELLDQEIDDIRIPGMTHNFLYGEVHDDDASEAAMNAGHFLQCLFEKNPAGCALRAGDDGFVDPSGGLLARERLAAAWEECLARITAFTHCEIEHCSCVINGESGEVTFRVAWEGLEAATMKPLAATGTAVLRVQKTAVGWVVSGADIPGFRW